ncbi:MAG: hypothetical protein K2L22_02960 [Muribaculaceae bacterium]|nr:hypothetical protein [Muribaculaceae bacterium]
MNGSTGAIEQTVAYYPYGAVIADLGTAATSGQPFKFGGKELITANGLNEYDFGARYYYPTAPGFTKPDPMAEKYPWLSRFLTSRTTAPSSTPCQTASFPHQPSRCRFLRNPAFCKPFQ